MVLPIGNALFKNKSNKIIKCNHNNWIVIFLPITTDVYSIRMEHDISEDTLLLDAIVSAYQYMEVSVIDLVLSSSQQWVQK